MKHVLLATAALLTIGAAAPAEKASPIAKTAAAAKVDLAILHVQVVLDKLGYSPGVLDGKRGESLKFALKDFQAARGLEPTGEIDQATLAQLKRYEGWTPVKRLRLDEAALAGPYTPVIPSDNVEKGKLPALAYRNPLEALAERFHTTPATLIALNSRETQLVPGSVVNFPNALPTSRDYQVKDGTGRDLMNRLNVTATTAKAERVEVDKSDGVLRAYDANDRVIFSSSATMGSKLDPLPLGRWKILSVAYNPPWKYQPAILKKADKSDPETLIKGGPNNPVGVVWIDLSKEHYGIHGTAEPQQIGRAESNGCVRLTNWDAARLSQMVGAGTEVIFKA